MSLHDAFLADIIEHPDDDAPRLVFADWLEDNGDPDRAEFIRAQCELARVGDEAHSTGLLARESSLLQRNEGRWSEPLRQLGVEWWTFRRGFVEVVALQGMKFAIESARLFTLAPVRDVTLYRVQRCRGLLLGCAEIDRPAALRLHSGTSSVPELERLLRERVWVRLRTLEVRGIFHGANTGRTLGWLTNVPTLTELGLLQCGVCDAGLAAIGNSPLGSRLEAIDLRGNSITDAGAQALAELQLPQLRWLNLGGNLVSDVGITALLDSPRLTALRHILCDQHRLSPALRERLVQRAGR